MKSNYLPQLDGLRTIAVSLVMFGHYTMINNHLMNYDKMVAYSGVDLFFVLSGFLITSILIKNRNIINNSKSHILRQFYIRRFLRIFPLYYFIILIGLVFIIPNVRQDLWWLLTYTSNILVAITNGNGGNYTHLWSLSVEEQFYIFFPMLFLIIPKTYIKNLFITLIVIGLVSRIIVYLYFQASTNNTWFTYSLTPCCLDSFGLGSLLAYFTIYNRKHLVIFLKKFKWFFTVPLIIGIIMFLSTVHWIITLNNIFFRFFISLFCFWVIGMASNSIFTGFWSKFLENKIIVYLGKISYGLYVYHYFMFFLFAKFHIIQSNSIKSILITSLLYTITTIIISSISFRFFEKPINNLKERFEYD